MLNFFLTGQILTHTRAETGVWCALMAYDSAAERVRQRIREWIASEGRGSQKRLAAAVPGKFGEPKTEQWLSDILKGKTDLSLRDIDAVADHLGVPPGILIRRHDRNYEELTMAESRLLSYYRSWPETIRHTWLTWLEYLTRFQRDAAYEGRVKKQKQTRGTRKKEHPAARKSLG